MKYEQPNCPECGAKATGQIEWVPGTVGLMLDDDGTFQDYTGTTDMHWDGSTENNTLLNEDDETHRLTCGLHEWDSPVTGGFEREEEPAQ